MIFGGKSIHELEEADIRALKEKEVGESRILDYKREMYSNSDADKRDLACDVSAFANSSGGFLIVGVECDEESNKPTEIIGIDKANTESRIESVCLDRVDEPLSHGRDYRLKAVSLQSSDKVVLVVQILESLRAPHMVSFQKQRYFYVRHGRQNRPADINDLRAIFDKVQGYMNKAESFVATRKAKHGNPNKNGFGWITLSAVPLVMRGDLVRVDADTSNWFRLATRPRTGRSDFPGSGNLRPSINGFSYIDLAGADRVRSRLDVFRNGSVELGLDLTPLGVDLNQHRADEQRIIPSLWIALTFLDALYFVGQLYQFCEYYGEVRVVLHLTDARVYKLTDRVGWPGHSRLCGENEFEGGTDATTLELVEKPEKVLKAIMDRLSNAFGYMGSDCFDEQGQILLQ